jgi:hypothetical protein
MPRVMETLELCYNSAGKTNANIVRTAEKYLAYACDGPAVVEVSRTRSPNWTGVQVPEIDDGAYQPMCLWRSSPVNSNQDEKMPTATARSMVLLLSGRD